MENLVEKALVLAANAHTGQKDKSGKPYIFHCLIVAKDFIEEGNELLTAAALLHDVVEDTELDLEDIEENVSTEVARLVGLLTKTGELSYSEYINNIADDAQATQIKKKDIEHNMKLSRLPTLNEKDFGRLKRYHTSLKKLG